ncbi:MAG: site-specific DNA-methyltransferase, partial [Armatimonadota bacterium]|nr:site-specific DNA-methyltransferase [Armatimonadota bacterium]
IILDFFAGSGTTAQAVLGLNKEDGGNRKFILVQLPEKTMNPQFPTIAEITKERVRRVIKKLNAADTGKLSLGEGTVLDRGFKAFKLTASNFKIWDAVQAPNEPAALAEQLALFADNLQPDSGPEDVLFEILLKAGYNLNAPRETLTIAGQPIYSIDGGRLLVCLEEQMTQEVLRGVIASKPEAFICLDAAFHGSDRLLTNAELEMKSSKILFQTV